MHVFSSRVAFVQCAQTVRQFTDTDCSGRQWFTGGDTGTIDQWVAQTSLRVCPRVSRVPRV